MNGNGDAPAQIEMPAEAIVNYLSQRLSQVLMELELTRAMCNHLAGERDRLVAELAGVMGEAGE